MRQWETVFCETGKNLYDFLPVDFLGCFMQSIPLQKAEFEKGIAIPAILL